MSKQHILDLEEDQLEYFLKENNHPSFRKKQIYKWIYQGINSFFDMTDLPVNLRNILDEKFYILTGKIIKKLGDQKTQKYLIEQIDGSIIECVRMVYNHGISLCVSSQVGCRMGCVFCASTMNGLTRNLKWWEMLEQLILVNNLNERNITHIVIMGSGEPLDNYREVITFLKNTNKNLDISYRRMTISTCGVVPGILKLAEENIPITLSISLHGCTNELRSKLMPINKKYPLEELMKAVDVYINKTSRRVTFEYTLIDNVNDTPKDAVEITRLLKGKLVHINLIPYNPIEGKTLGTSEKNKILEFKSIIEGKGIPVTIRREMGRNINAACGQLRNKHMLK